MTIGCWIKFAQHDFNKTNHKEVYSLNCKTLWTSDVFQLNSVEICFFFSMWEGEGREGKLRLRMPSEFWVCQFNAYVPLVSLQIESCLDNKIPSLDVINSSFPVWAAGGLSAVLLPSLPPVVPPSSRSRSRVRTTQSRQAAPVVKRGPKRPSLRYSAFLTCPMNFCLGYFFYMYS